MNLDELGVTHGQWKRALRRFLAGQEAAPKTVHACGFEAWAKTAKVPGGWAELEAATKAHAALHAAANEVISLARTNVAKAGELLDGVFSVALGEFERSLTALKQRQVQQPGGRP